MGNEKLLEAVFPLPRLFPHLFNKGRGFKMFKCYWKEPVSKGGGDPGGHPQQWEWKVGGRAHRQKNVPPWETKLAPHHMQMKDGERGCHHRSAEGWSIDHSWDDWTREANWLRGTTHSTGKTTHHECLEASASKAVSCPLTSSNSPGGEQEHSPFSAQQSQTTRPITHSKCLHSTSIYCTSVMSQAMYFKHLWTNRHPPPAPPPIPWGKSTLNGVSILADSVLESDSYLYKLKTFQFPSDEYLFLPSGKKNKALNF